MSRIAYCKDGVTLKHSPSCRMAFGRLDPQNCARCEEREQERKQGIEARTNAAVEAKQRNAYYQSMRDAEIRNHDCKAERCGIVCTRFDW